MSLAPVSFHSPMAPCSARFTWWLRGWCNSGLSCYNFSDSLQPRSNTVVVDKEEKRDCSPWHWSLADLLFSLCPGCSASRNSILWAEFTFAMALLKSLEANQGCAWSSLGFCSSHGKCCTHRCIFLSFMSPVIGFCLLFTPATRLEPSDSHKVYHSLLALLPGFNKLFSYAMSSAQTLD